MDSKHHTPKILLIASFLLSFAACAFSLASFALHVAEYPLQKRELAQSITFLDPQTDSPRVRIDASLANGQIWIDTGTSPLQQISICDLCEHLRSSPN